MAFLITLLLSALVAGLLSIWEGFVFMKMWAWFVVPIFGLPAITIPVAIGIALLIGFLTHQRNGESDDPMDYAVKSFSHGFVNSGVVLLIGYIVTFFL